MGCHGRLVWPTILVQRGHWSRPQCSSR